MSAPDVLVDTSVAISLTIADHEHHKDVVRALNGRSLGLAGHAAFETFSVLTRLPPPARRTPASASRLITVNFPHSRFLSPNAAAALLTNLNSTGIAGGSVYDALVGRREGVRRHLVHPAIEEPPRPTGHSMSSST